MKKTSAYSLFILSSFLFSCGSSPNSASESKEPTEDMHKSMAMEMQAPRAMAGLSTIPAPTGTNVHLCMAKEAINNISNYAASSQKVGTQSSFVFKTAQLLDYINASQSTIVNFIFGSNTANDSLFLYMAPVTQDGTHLFYDRNDTCFVLSETYAVDIPTTLERQTSTIDTFFMEAMCVTDAQAMIDAYATSQRKPGNNGWLYNAHDLAGYLMAGMNAGGMEYTQFILALDGNGVADLIIVGSNDGTNHMYFDFNQKQCVMENVTPCPYCDIASGGTTFDSPPCSY